MTTNKSTLPNYKWIKFDLEYLNNPDFFQITEAAAGAFLKLYLLAGKADAGGLLCNSDKVFTPRDLAWFLRCTPDTINAYLEELKNAGFIAVDGDGFMIPRFLEEQGPGDNDRREEWRARQGKHRARARKEPEPEQEPEREPVVEAEGEGRGRVEVDIESHGDVTVTQPPPPPAAASSSSDGELLDLWIEETGNKRPSKERKPLILETLRDWGAYEISETRMSLRGRLGCCVTVWKRICENHPEWSPRNWDAILEMFPMPELESRMEREGLEWNDKEREEARKRILSDYGLLEEEPNQPTAADLGWTPA